MGQDRWNWCNRCQVLFYGPKQGSSHCPATHGAHDPTGSDSHDIYLVSSPEGSVGNMGVAHPEVFGTAANNASGGVIAVCQTPFRTFYACRSNDDNSDPNASAPALASFRGTLYPFYRTWYQNKWGYGPVQCLPIIVTDGIRLYELSAGIVIRSTPALLCLFADREPSDPPASPFHERDCAGPGMNLESYYGLGERLTGRTIGNR